MKRSNMFKALSLFLAFTLAVSPVSAMAAEQSITDDAVIEESFEEQIEETGSAESTVEETTFDEAVEAPVQESEEAEESLDAQGEE
ncbi:MAG: hypothetical protein IKR68_01960, partial [Lachnospiraceae bacterium]|nr:hypothetical protein [Lachnospiraceae bacterium]